ncbi:MAG: YfbK domain-containing protein [Ilumatobacteraceae bacterium]
MNRPVAISAIAVVLLSATACTDDDTTSGTTSAPRSIGVDPRSYFDDYVEEEEELVFAIEESPEPLADEGGVVEPPPAPEPIPPEVTEDNTFVDAGQSVWTATADDAESTFALDVDTGSFSIARRFVAEGFVPEPDSIRPEEWINSFDYGDPAAIETDLAATVELGQAPYAGEAVELVRVGVTTRTIAAEDRPPASLTFVVDTSGSMDIRERLGLVQASLALLAEQLNDDDTIAIVTYGSDARALLPPTPASDTQTIVSAINRLVSGGSTNMEAGLRTGYAQARASFREDGVNTVILASDGVANVGVDDPDGLAGLIEQSGSDGIALVTVGYGMGNFNDDLMEQLADQGDGFYSYIDTFEEAERLFVDDLTPTLTVVAADAKVQVVFDPAVVEEYRLIGYENRSLDDSEFRDDTTDASELGAGHAATALYEIRRTADGDGLSPGEVRLRWESTASGAVVETETPIPAEPTADPTDAFQLAALVATAAEVLRQDPVRVERSITAAQLATDAKALVDAGVTEADEIAALLAAVAPFLQVPAEGQD